MNTWRNRFAVWLANACLLLASKSYRDTLKRMIVLGMETADSTNKATS